jgi:hypothetical protein
VKIPNKADKALDIARRREQVARLYAEGLSRTLIAQQLKVSDKTVFRDLRFIAKLWRRLLGRNLVTAKALELAKINRLEAAAWEAWERSYRDEESTKVTVDGEKKRAEKVTKNQSGDVKFLDRVAWCIEKRFNILALGELGDASGYGTRGDNIPLEQRRKRILALLDVFRERERAEAARPRAVDSPADQPQAADAPAALG